MPFVSHCLLTSAGTAAALLVCSALCIAPATAASYSFASVESSYPAYFGAPSINDYGRIDFNAVRNDGTRVIYTVGGGLVRFETDDSVYLGNSSTNNRQYPFVFPTSVTYVRDGATNGIISYGEDIDFIATTSGEYSRLGAPAINGDAYVAYYAELDGGGSGVYVSHPYLDGFTVADHEGLFSSFGEIVSINNPGQVAFTAAAGSLEVVAVAANSSDFSIVASTSGAFQSFAAPSINDAGAVAFRANLDGGGSGIFISDGDSIATVADLAGSFASFDSPVINNRGDVAFAAVVDTIGDGIYTGGDPLNDKVVQVGDALFGSTVADLEFFRGLNNHGAIAFRYALDDGQQGIAVATPVPEPGALALSLLGLTAAGLSRRSRS